MTLMWRYARGRRQASDDDAANHAWDHTDARFDARFAHTHAAARQLRTSAQRSGSAARCAHSSRRRRHRRAHPPQSQRSGACETRGGASRRAPPACAVGWQRAGAPPPASGARGPKLRALVASGGARPGSRLRRRRVCLAACCLPTRTRRIWRPSRASCSRCMRRPTRGPSSARGLAPPLSCPSDFSPCCPACRMMCGRWLRRCLRRAREPAAPGARPAL